MQHQRKWAYLTLVIPSCPREIGHGEIWYFLAPFTLNIDQGILWVPRIFALFIHDFSPIPPVNTSASRPPKGTK